MRIISGKFKGKKLSQPLDKLTRPLKDLTKESIFNILEHSNKFKIRVKNSKILDLFSGTGSFGIECLSRDAAFVTFVEHYSNIINILKKNIDKCEVENVSEIIQKKIDNEFDFTTLKEYEIIFFDPPYKDENIHLILEKLIQSNILKKNGLLIMHRHKKSKDLIPHQLKILEDKSYGIAKILFISLR